MVVAGNPMLAVDHRLAVSSVPLPTPVQDQDIELTKLNLLEPVFVRHPTTFRLRRRKLASQVSVVMVLESLATGIFPDRR